MTPTMQGIDHVHVYVASWDAAEKWYAQVMGFKRVEAFMSWAVKGGPLTLESLDGNVHLALFERDNHPASSTIAFAASGEEFMAWKAHLESKGLELEVKDHKLAYSMYFSDPDQNMHEITTYERDYVAGRLAGAMKS